MKNYTHDEKAMQDLLSRIDQMIKNDEWHRAYRNNSTGLELNDAEVLLNALIGQIAAFKIDRSVSKELKSSLPGYEKDFVEKVYEIAFGEEAINKEYTHEEVLEQLMSYSDKALFVDEQFDEVCGHGSSNCDGDKSMEEMFDFYEESIEEVGWAAISVGADEDSPPFAYSVGLSVANVELPEVICIGLSMEVAHSVLGTVIDIWKTDGFKLGIISGVLNNGDLDVKLVELDLANSHPGSDDFFPYHSFAYRHHKGLDAEKTRFVQVIFPDTNNHFESSPVQPFLPPKLHLREV